MANEESKDHLFLKICYVILFYIIYGFSDLVLVVIAIIQSVLSIFSGEPSMTLSRFGSSFGVYVKQIAAYVSYASEEKPYPFADWPEPEVGEAD